MRKIFALGLLAMGMLIPAAALGQGYSTTTITSVTPNPATYGQTVTIVAGVWPSLCTGQVDFQTPSGDLGSATLDGNSNATLQISNLPVGSYSLKAYYEGDWECDPSNTTWYGTLVINGVTTLTAVSSNSNPSTYGNSVTFTATVSPSAAAGTVTFKDGSNTLGTGTLSGGTAHYTLTSLTAGSHSITAVYPANGNYNGSTSSTLTQTVNKATPTVSWSNPSAITYGTALSGTQLNATASVQGTFAYSPASGTVLAAGSSSLSTTFTPTDTTDYNTATGGATLTVNKAGLTVTASSGSMGYGGTPPSISPSYSGFVNGDTPSSLTTQPTCTTAATSSSSVAGSPYSSSCSGAASSNYTFTYQNGSVTVNAASLSITSSNGAMTYGGNAPTITPSYSGFVNGQTASSLTTQPTCTTAATNSSTVAGSPYSSSCSGAVDSNYSIAYHAGSVTVNAAGLTVTASSGSMSTAGPCPALLPATAGLCLRRPHPISILNPIAAPRPRLPVRWAVSQQLFRRCR